MLISGSIWQASYNHGHARFSHWWGGPTVVTARAYPLSNLHVPLVGYMLSLFFSGVHVAVRETVQTTRLALHAEQFTLGT